MTFGERAKAALEVMRRRACWLYARRWRVGLAIVAFLLLVPRVIVPERVPEIRVESRRADADTLVVVLHGMTGRRTLEPMLAAVEDHYPGADLIAPVFTRWLTSSVSNLDAYELSNAIEQTIHEAHERKQYRRIVLVGYSMGALVARKVLLWAHGEEHDRTGSKGRRKWVESVDRVVSLAGMSRGWSIDPAPTKMSWYRYATYWLGEKISRLTGTGKLILSMQRGAPFVADSRVQWIELARKTALPPVVHLLGDRDDIVSIDDSRDLAAAASVVFITLADTDHQDIIEGLELPLQEGDVSAYSARRRAIDRALGGDVRTRPVPGEDRQDPIENCPAGEKARKADPRFAKRIVYIMHGIRDYADWADRIRAESAEGLKGKETVTVPAKYGWFPMIPFLLYYDRHRNVRWFMDAYTAHLAEMPCLKRVDFMGHSNGTYILASALQHYKTLKVQRVYFAGSVVPKHYPWLALRERVGQVDNVVASGDWVVAIFPRLFEQVAEWIGTKPTTGLLDLGSAGFRGFEDGSSPGGKVRNIAYTSGGHGAGVDVSDKAKLDALVGFVLDRDRDALVPAFWKVGEPDGAISSASNASLAVWLLLAAALAGIGWLLWNCRIAIDISRVPRTINFGLAPFATFVVVVALVFYSF